MKPIEITEKNYKWIYSRLDRIFSRKELFAWFSHDCGLKKRFKPKQSKGWPRRGGKRNLTVSFVKRTLFVGDTFPRYYIQYEGGGADTIVIGDVVCFLGNRVIIQRKHVEKRVFTPIGFIYEYSCYQIGHHE